MNCLRYMNFSSRGYFFKCDGISLCSGDTCLIFPRCFEAGFFRKASIGVVAKVQLLIQHTRFDHQVTHHVEVGLPWREWTIDNPVERLCESPSQQRRLLVVVEASNKIGCVFAMRLALVQPET